MERKVGQTGAPSGPSARGPLIALFLLRRAQSLVALLGILILAVLISPTASDGSRIFLQAGNLTDILRQISLIGIVSLAMTFVILTGGIDLSVGSILALSTALAAMFLTRGYTTHIAV